MNPVAQAVDTCRALTARMVDAAERGDWQTVTSLDAERRACFDGVDVAALRPDALETVLGEFRALMTIDDHLRERAADARHTSLAQVRKIRARRDGRARYREQAARG